MWTNPQQQNSTACKWAPQKHWKNTQDFALIYCKLQKVLLLWGISWLCSCGVFCIAANKLCLSATDPSCMALLLRHRVAEAGMFVLHWLHTLLLQPDSQLSLLWSSSDSVGGNGSSGRGDSSSCIIESILAVGPGEFDTKVLQQLQQQLLEPGSDMSMILYNDFKPWLSADTRPEPATKSGTIAAEAAAAAAAVSGSMQSVQLAAVRARAAYALLVVAVKQQRRLVVRWLLGRLQQQRLWLEQGHCTAEAVLVAQQRVAWSGMLPGFHPPLLALAAAVGSDTTIAKASGCLGNFVVSLWTK
jgi:hypothetical protein